MIRKFALVVLDKTDNIIDRFNLDEVNGLNGLGYELDISVIDTDIEAYVTKIIQKKRNLKLNVVLHGGYIAGTALDFWYQKHINDDICLEYNDTNSLRYINGKILSSDKTELDNFGNLILGITFQPLTPFFRIIKNETTIEVATIGKNYPYKYPYHYGLNIVENNEIENPYITEIPLIVTITGTITNPIITLRDENNIIYNEVRFLDTYLTEEQTLIIDSARRKIWFDNGSGNLVDYYYRLDGAYDSYLRVKPQTKSKININLEASDTGSLRASRRQYTL